MIQINRATVDSLSKQNNSKVDKGIEDSALYPIYVHSAKNLSDLCREYSTYEMAHWTNYVDRFCTVKNTNSHNTTGCKRGSIVLVDLGAGNFGYEPSFTHPAVVLSQNRYNIMIAPCSSKKYGKGFPDIIDATPSDGFSTNTGIQTDSIRWISKDRIISTHGSVSNSVLDQIDAKLLAIIPTYKRTIMSKDSDIQQLTSEKTALENDKAQLEAEVESLKAKLAALTAPTPDAEG